ncbi:hypothetical protein JCM8202_005509 [Rhodotorula sphaerocarpa]
MVRSKSRPAPAASGSSSAPVSRTDDPRSRKSARPAKRVKYAAAAAATVSEDEQNSGMKGEYAMGERVRGGGGEGGASFGRRAADAVGREREKEAASLVAGFEKQLDNRIAAGHAAIDKLVAEAAQKLNQQKAELLAMKAPQLTLVPNPQEYRAAAKRQEEYGARLIEAIEALTREILDPEDDLLEVIEQLMVARVEKQKDAQKKVYKQKMRLSALESCKHLKAAARA